MTRLLWHVGLRDSSTLACWIVWLSVHMLSLLWAVLVCYLPLNYPDLTWSLPESVGELRRKSPRQAPQNL